MAEVTGQIGSEYVELDNAATEATLQELLKATAAMARTAKVDSKAAQQELEKLYKSSRKLNVQQIKDQQTKRRAAQAAQMQARQESASKDALAATEAEYTKTKQASNNRLLAFAKAIEQTISTVINVTKAFASMGDSLSGAANTFTHIPIVGGLLGNYLGAIAGAVENAQKGFVNISSVGATMGGSLTAVIRSAGRAGLTVDQFTGIVAKNGEGLARLGEGTEDGFRRFRSMSTLMRNEVNNGLSNLGITTEEANSVMATYTSRLARSGQARNMSDAQLVASTKSYLQNLTAVSRLTGQTRAELEEQAAARERDASWNNWLASLDPDISGAAREAMSLFDAMGIGDLARDMIVAGAPLSEVTAKLAAMNPALAGTLEGFARAAETGDAGALEAIKKEAYEQTRTFAGELKESGLDQSLRILAAQGDAAAQAILGVANAGRALTDNYQEVVASVAADMAKGPTEMSAAVQAQQTIAERSANAQEQLVGRMGDLIKALNYMDLIMPAAIAGAVITALGAAAVGAALMKAFRSAGTGGGGAARAGGGAARAGGGMLAGLGKVAAGAARFAGPLALIATAGTAIYSAAKGFGQAAETFNLAEGQVATMGQKVASGYGNMIETLTFGLVDGPWVAQGVYGVGQSIAAGFTSVKDGVVKLWQNPEEVMKSVGDSIAAGFSRANQFVTGMWKGMTESRLGEAISQGFNSARDKVLEWGNSIAKGYENLKNQAQGLVTSVVAKAQELSPKVQEALSKTADAAKDAVSSGWNKVTSFFARSPSEVAQAVSNQPVVATAAALPAGSGAAGGSAAGSQNNSESLISNLNTRLDKMIALNAELIAISQQQLAVQKGLSGNLYDAV